MTGHASKTCAPATASPTVLCLPELSTKATCPLSIVARMSSRWSATEGMDAAKAFH